MRKPVTVMLNELQSMLLRLEPDAIEVMHMQAQRMLAGRKQYGDLVIDKDQRDFLVQALEEYLDGSNYLAVELLKLLRMLGREPR